MILIKQSINDQNQIRWKIGVITDCFFHWLRNDTFVNASRKTALQSWFTVSIIIAKVVHISTTLHSLTWIHYETIPLDITWTKQLSSWWANTFEDAKKLGGNKRFTTNLGGRGKRTVAWYWMITDDLKWSRLIDDNRGLMKTIFINWKKLKVILIDFRRSSMTKIDWR